MDQSPKGRHCGTQWAPPLHIPLPPTTWSWSIHLPSFSPVTKPGGGGEGIKSRLACTPAEELGLHYGPAQLSAAIDWPWPW